MSVLVAIAATIASLDIDPVCREYVFEATPHIVCEVSRDADIRLRLYGDDGAPLGQFDALIAETPEPILMAMNAGMYHADRAPVGLYIEDGATLAPLVTRAGPGNFGLIPNGVFWSDGEQVHVTETLAFERLQLDPVFASQSGPMLVIDGDLHPRFQADSDSRKRRNGVGIAGDQVVFAISDAPVTFHHFARLFRDGLGADNALFLDGSISRIHAPELERSERGTDLGPIVEILSRDERKDLP